VITPEGQLLHDRLDSIERNLAHRRTTSMTRPTNRPTTALAAASTRPAR
jgi:hypothetical protein